MKLFKRTVAAIAVTAAIAAAALLGGCASKVIKVQNDYGSNNYVIIVTDDVVTLTETTSLYDYMCALQADGQITFEVSDGSYGKYITSVEGVSEKSESATSGYSWMIYTDLTELDGVVYSDPSYGTWTYDNKTLNSASYGVSGLPAVEGYTYALVYSYWSY